MLTKLFAKLKKPVSNNETAIETALQQNKALLRQLLDESKI